MSKFATILGLIIGSIILILSMIDYQQGEFISAFLNWQGLALVLGGRLPLFLSTIRFSRSAVFSKAFLKYSPRNLRPMTMSLKPWFISVMSPNRRVC